MKPKGIAEDIRASLPDLGRVPQAIGRHRADHLSIGVVVSRYNDDLTGGLVDHCVRCLQEHGAPAHQPAVFWVPGAFEIPLILKKLAATTNYNALIALGAIIEGETNHARIISEEVARAISDLSREFEIPIIDTVVSAPTLEQASARCLGGKHSRGWYAALAAMEMAHLVRGLG